MKKLQLTGLKGFTLIELLVVVAIIGLLTTIIAGPIQNARVKAKDTKKIADLKVIQSALMQYAVDNGSYPTPVNLTSALVPKYLDSLPRNILSAYLPLADKYVYTVYNTGSVAVPTYTGYHLGVKLYASGNSALDNDADCVAALNVAAGATSCVLTGQIVRAMLTNVTSNATAPSHPGSPASTVADFKGVFTPDNSTATGPVTCIPSTMTSCIYDVRSNI